MKNLLRKATPINEAARRELGISRDEYALCSYILYRSADPRQKVRGYCCDAKQDIADFIGITRAGLYKMADRLIAANLIECDSVTAFFTVTADFIDMENECKQSLHNEQTECKQSLQRSVNKVTDKELMYSKIKKDNKSSEIEKPYWDTCYTFAEFWNAYGHKVGSKKKAEQSFDKLSEKDREDIKTALSTYVNGTVTAKVSTLPGQAFRPFRAHPTTFLNERRWETILETVLDKIEESKNILPEWDVKYGQYIDWIKRNYPALLNSAKYLSKRQYAAYHTEIYVKGCSRVGKEAQKRLLTKCHNEMNDNPDILNRYTDVFAMHCEKMVPEVESRLI